MSTQSENTTIMKEIAIYFIAAIALFFAPIKGLLVGVGVAIALDTFSGVYRSIKLKGWKCITSRRFSEVISKMLLYQVTIICLYIIDFFILSEFFQPWFSISFVATKSCAMLLIFIEMVSVKENFERALGIDIWKLVKTALTRANELKDDIIDFKKIGKDDNN
jgi:hypothetical protein